MMLYSIIQLLTVALNTQKIIIKLSPIAKSFKIITVSKILTLCVMQLM